MPAGASKKREREYKKLKNEFKESGRYKGREEEVASRIVNKQRRQFGETKKAKQKDRQGRSPDKNLPIKDYQHLTVSEVLKKAEAKSEKQMKEIISYEKSHKNRKTLLERLEAQT